MVLAADSADTSGSEAAASAPASTEVGPAYANDGESRATASDAASTAVPIWEFSGVSLSVSRVTSGQTVTVTPQVSGDLDGATYNYVWSYGGGWDLWGSTVHDTGKATAEATGTLSLYRPGRYVVYVDVIDRSGQKRTMSAELEAYDDSWSLDGVVATPSSVVAGDEVTYAPKVSGDTSGLTYNYVWQWEGSWAEGDWGSTELYTGRHHGGLPHGRTRRPGPLHPLRGRGLRPWRETHSIGRGRGVGCDGRLRLRIGCLRLDGAGRPLRWPRSLGCALPLPLDLCRRLGLGHAQRLVEHNFGELFVRHP